MMSAVAVGSFQSRGSALSHQSDGSILSAESKNSILSYRSTAAVRGERRAAYALKRNRLWLFAGIAIALIALQLSRSRR
jgi:hypothetical protein